ncbi:MAG: DUF2232 domain-containing protein [Proteocatella sp.]
MQHIFFRYKRDKKEAFIETIKYSIAIVVVLLITKLVPVLSPVALLLPSLFAVVTFRNGMAFNFIAAIIITLATSVFTDPLIALYMAFTMGGVGLLIGELSYRRRAPALSIFAGAFMVIINMLLLMYIEARMMNVDLLDYIINIYRESFETQKVFLNLDMDIDTFILNLRRTFPGMVVCMGFAVSTLNYFFTGNILMKVMRKRETATLAEFTLPGNVFGGITLIYLMAVFLIYSDFIYKDTLVINLTIIFGMLFFLQGIASIYYFMSMRLKPLPRNIITFMLCSFMPLYTFVVAIGFLDAIVNLRKIKK